MCFGEGQKADDRSDEGEGHVGLGVPDISLGTEKGFGVLPEEFCCPPLDQFVKGTEGEADRYNEKIPPSGKRNDLLADQNFPTDQGGDESLHEMSDFVVVITLPSKTLADPIKEGNLRVGILCPYHQNKAMNKDPKIEQGSERKRFTGAPHH